MLTRASGILLPIFSLPSPHGTDHGKQEQWLSPKEADKKLAVKLYSLTEKSNRI